MRVPSMKMHRNLVMVMVMGMGMAFKTSIFLKMQQATLK